ncbi:glucose 1-dehydrogenase [Streptomyces sp. SID3343]|nr:glucose 1-dehydrogenase [Streptomyces sp. SID3343]
MLEGKSAVVTGGSRGIGRAVVERLARDGAAVVFGYARDDKAAEDVVRTVEAAGGAASAVRCELSEPGAAEALMAQAHARLGGLDILVNNAGTSGEKALIADLDEVAFDHVMAINTKAPFLTIRYAARHMRDGGRIVNVSTLNTIRPAATIAAYAASKGALEQLTAVAAHELGARGITVNTVSPGATDTDLLRSANPAEALAAVPARTPLGRLGEPSDVADVIAFLAGPDGRWITAQNIQANGGLG